ncbi:uncharacterized protein Dwil_GK19803 [Drosophila willistoni]|uniref:Pentacotripeptide-repeat region of PRORP domain-containing protein n=2 Tax=Drosophila willistoni TaxID=7260 RepID=B4MXF4_DROWI|nr:pentatricopeptide repeat-containing protein 1, mitochondrial [Drosophila willistoni]EDW76723.1 uncharacterized protein Dwil_GK19803 [Drosophila willistoni]
MALRLLSLTLGSHIRRRLPIAPKSGFINHFRLGNPGTHRLLHVRITDQDAGMQAKREANKFDESHRQQPIIDEEEQQQPQVIKPVKKSPKTKSNEADLFGHVKEEDLSETYADPGDAAEEEFLSRPTRNFRKLRTKEYARLIKEHLNAHRLNEAIAVVEQRMLKEDRVKPENYIYNLLISGCAKEGYTRKAFQLYTKMRQRGLKVTGGTYTSLLNACANAPTSKDGLQRIQLLRESMLEKDYEPNVKNYNAMIKAYGRCGDVASAYQIADEMLERKLLMNAETFNFLLQACAGDEEHGFRHALITWHKMLQSGIKPDYYSFGTMLRCVRDCKFGSLDDMRDVLNTICPSPAKDEVKQINSSSADQTIKSQSALNPFSANGSQIELIPSSDDNHLELPNLLLPQPHLGSLVSLADVIKPHERFLLLGGLTGFLEHMKQLEITPDIECFTLMLEVIPPTNAAEKQLLGFVRKIGLKADIDFFNILIKKRSMRFDYASAREVLTMIRTAGLKPDIITYGVLALGCRTQEEARELLQEMQAADIRMNMPILGAMLRQGCAQRNFAYINEIMQLCLEEKLKPNESFLRHLHNFHRGCARAIDARHPSTKTTSYKKGHSKFCDKYRMFYEEHGLSNLKLEDAIAKIKERPYAQYKKPNVEGMESLKHEQIKRKTKLRKYIKKIKINELQDDPDPPRLRESTVKQLE